MIVFLIILFVLVVGAVVAVVVGRVGIDSMSEPGTTSGFELPDGRIGARGPDVVRLDQSFRGYNMAQVDSVLDRLFDEIAMLEDEVAHRQGRPTNASAGDAGRRRAVERDEATDVDASTDLDEPTKLDKPVERPSAGQPEPQADAHAADDGEIVPLRRGVLTTTE